MGLYFLSLLDYIVQVSPLDLIDVVVALLALAYVVGLRKDFKYTLINFRL